MYASPKAQSIMPGLGEDNASYAPGRQLCTDFVERAVIVP